MKKYYRKLKIKLILLLTVVILVGCCGIIYQKADRIRASYVQEMYEFYDEVVEIRSNSHDEDFDDDIVIQAYEAYYHANSFSDAGFYSMLKCVKDHSTVAEVQSYLIVQNCDGGGFTNDKRILLLGDDLKLLPEKGYSSLLREFFSSMEIIGTCDDTYIYLEELRWSDIRNENSYSYIPKDKIIAPAETVEFEEWSGDRYFSDESIDCDYYVRVNNEYPLYWYDKSEEVLDEEARIVCERIYNDIVNDNISMDDQSKKGIFTCVIANVGFISDDYYMPYVYVFHPVNLAIDELSGVLFLIAVMWLIMIFIVIGLVNQVYRKQLAHEANRLNLTRGIAHELKTPLAITKGYVENWKYVKEADRETYSKTMLEEMEHMDHMVMDLLELSRLEAKRKEPNSEPVDIYGLSLSVLNRMNSLIEERGLTVTDRTTDKDHDKEPGLVNADLEMMRTVILNFITNAVKYADKTIDFSVMVTDKKVRFVIINDGRTISPDKINKIWDEFYMDSIPDGSTGSAGSGDRLGSSGLGLAIAKNILLLHHAKYGCESKDGRTIFWFEMKRISEE